MLGESRATILRESAARREGHLVGMLGNKPVRTLALVVLIAGSYIAGSEVMSLKYGRTRRLEDIRAYSDTAVIEYYSRLPRMNLPGLQSPGSVVVTIFMDYQTRSSWMAYEELEAAIRLLELHDSRRVDVVLRDFPIDTACNRFIATSKNAAACEAALAMRLAREARVEKDVARRLALENQRLTAELIWDIASDFGVDRSPHRYRELLHRVKEDIGIAQQLGVSASPSVVINGAVIRGGVPAVPLAAILRYETQKWRGSLQ